MSDSDNSNKYHYLFLVLKLQEISLMKEYLWSSFAYPKNNYVLCLTSLVFIQAESYGYQIKNVVPTILMNIIMFF